jgi:predicted nicotinamide N-methyase
MELWRTTRSATGDPDQPIPFWGVVWGGGLAIARYLRDHPAVVLGRRVLDLGSGSGLCAIAAAQAGARSVTAVDVDPYALAAIEVNARANRQQVDVLGADLLDDGPPRVDLVLAGDCWYEGLLADRATAFLRRAWLEGIDVLLGDPGRRFLRLRDLTELASYELRTPSDLEDRGRTRAWVRTFATVDPG